MRAGYVARDDEHGCADISKVDLTHSIRVKCADPACEPGDGVDICPSCFCRGTEFGKHKNSHSYRIVVRYILSRSTRR